MKPLLPVWLWWRPFQTVYNVFLDQTFFHFRDGDLKRISFFSMTTAAAFIDRFCLLWHRDYDGSKSPESKAFLGERKHKKQPEEWAIEVEPKKTLWVVLEKWYLQQDIENYSGPIAWDKMAMWLESKANYLSALSVKLQEGKLLSARLHMPTYSAPGIEKKILKCLLKVLWFKVRICVSSITWRKLARLRQKPFLHQGSKLKEVLTRYLGYCS